MSTQRPVFDVQVEDADDPIRVTIKHQDYLRAETMAERHGLPADVKAAPMTWTTLWCWCALTREKAYDKPWEQFKNVDCTGVDTVEETEVDPTQPAAVTGSP